MTIRRRAKMVGFCVLGALVVSTQGFAEDDSGLKTTWEQVTPPSKKPSPPKKEKEDPCVATCRKVAAKEQKCQDAASSCQAAYDKEKAACYARCDAKGDAAPSNCKSLCDQDSYNVSECSKKDDVCAEAEAERKKTSCQC